jgi:hypothetical protein
MQVKDLNLSTELHQLPLGWGGRLIKQIELSCLLTPEELQTLSTGKFKLNLNIEIEGAMLERGEIIPAFDTLESKVKNHYRAVFIGDDYKISTDVIV